MPQESLNIILGPFQQLLSKVMHTLPGIAAAIVLLLLGMLLAAALRKGVERFLNFLRLDDHAERIKLNEVLARLGFGRSPRQILGFLVYWLILLMFVVSAANAVHLTVVSDLLGQFVLFIPKVIAAVLVLAGGLLFGHFVGEIVHNAAAANHLDGAILLSKASRFVVVAFTTIMALQQIGIDTTIITSSVQIILASIGLGLALAFGLGGRDTAADLIRALKERH